MSMSDNVAIERKIIRVTGKRQITIPLKFYEKLNFGKEVECYLADDSIVLWPLSTLDDNFVMEILKDLVSQGYCGDELIEKFAEQRRNVKKAVEVLVDETDEIAERQRRCKR